jgi:hypothetical protein
MTAPSRLLGDRAKGIGRLAKVTAEHFFEGVLDILGRLAGRLAGRV